MEKKLIKPVERIKDMDIVPTGMPPRKTEEERTYFILVKKVGFERVWYEVDGLEQTLASLSYLTSDMFSDADKSYIGSEDDVIIPVRQFLKNHGIDDTHINDKVSYMDKLRSMFPGKKLEGTVCLDINKKIHISFYGCEAVGDGFCTSIGGRGNTVEEACEDYYNEIQGKTLRFYNDDGSKEEFKVTT